VGTDNEGNVEPATEQPDDVTLRDVSFAAPGSLEISAFDVQHGATQRSFIRYVQLTFNESGQALQDIIDSLSDGDPTNDRLQLVKYGLTGPSDASDPGTPVDLSQVSISLIDHVIELDFGPAGLGGDPWSNLADGYYRLQLDLNDDLSDGLEARRHFFRLLGNVNDDRVVDAADFNQILTSYYAGGSPEEDVNGDGAVNIYDLMLASMADGRSLDGDLWLDD
jgi:hypothetical protein